jgi:hypothetical protein
MASRLKSPVLYPEFGDDHERVGQVDESKSPYIIMKLWETELKGAAGENDLIVNSPACPQKIFTKIYDRTVKFHVEACQTEEAFSNVVYHKGSSKLGKSLFRLNIQPTLMAPTAYFPMEKKGDMQFKCSRLNVTKKLPVASNYGMSADEEERLMAEMMAFENKDAVSEGGKRGRADESVVDEQPPLKRVKTTDEIEVDRLIALDTQ